MFNYISIKFPRKTCAVVKSLCYYNKTNVKLYYTLYAADKMVFTSSAGINLAPQAFLMLHNISMSN